MKELFLKAVKTSVAMIGATIFCIALLTIQGGWLGFAIGLGISALMWVEYVVVFVALSCLITSGILVVNKIKERRSERRGA